MVNRRKLILATAFCLLAIGCLFTAYADSIIAQYRNAVPCGELHGFAGFLQSVRLLDVGECTVRGTGACQNPGADCIAGGVSGFCTNVVQGGGTTCVCVPPPRGLSIVKTHSGNFFQDQTGAQYTITVSNDGSPSTGTVSVSDQVPAGLTATGIAGTNWTCTQPAGPCSRSDSLATNATYESITLTVDVAANAPLSVTNSASLSGTNVIEGIAQDQTTINCHLVVDNNNDSGTGSLRAVIANACANSTITFAPNVRGAIALTTTELLINNNLTIIGPGANLLSVQRDAGAGAFRIFDIASASVNANISGLKIANGNAAGTNGGGGGIYNTGTLTLTNSTISGNSGSGGSFGGGGIYNAGGTMTIANSTVSGNTVNSSFGGGGIVNTGGTMTIINSTISGNSAGSGGGIFNWSTGTVKITNGTISGNSAAHFGGVTNASNGIVHSGNTLIALNTSPSSPDINGSFISDGHNLIGNGTGGTGFTNGANGDQVGVADPKLDTTLTNNGGPTDTIALLISSPAINAGDDSIAPKTDQRVYLRSGVSDIGAFEFSGTPIRITSITRLANGHIILQGVGVPKASHTIQASLTPAAADFSAIAPVLGDGSGALQYDDDGAVGLTKRFYRLSFP